MTAVTAVGALAALVRDAATRSPGAVVTDRRTALALTDAVRRADEVAAGTRRLAGRRDPVVAVLLPASVDAVVHVLAAVLGGHTVCLLDPAAVATTGGGGGADRTGAVLSALGPDVLVDGAGMRPAARSAPPAAPGYVAMSSGSTGGAPKGVLTAWDRLADFAPHGAASLRLGPGAAWTEPSHPAYDLAMTNWVLALAAGASLHVSGALGDRLRPLGFAARVGGTHVRLAPRFSDLAAAEAARGTPATLRVWGSGGDRLTPAQAERVLGLGVPVLVNTYGTSETGGFASAAAFESPDDVTALHGSVTVGDGRVGPWSLEVSGEEVDGRDVDVLAVRPGAVSGGGGYLFGGERLDYPRWEGGRVVTGDLGARVGDRLFCFGRSGRLVKRSASFVNLDDVDLLLAERRGLDTFTVSTQDGSLVTLVEAAPQRLAGVREGLGELLAPDVLPDALVPVARLPRLGNGKTDQQGALRIAERAVGP